MAESELEGDTMRNEEKPVYCQQAASRLPRMHPLPV